MKKTIISAIMGCMLLLPAAAAAMEPITEAEMDKVTGRRGINFVIDDVQIYKHLASGGYYYQDGTDGQTAAFGIIGMQGILDINAIMPGATSDAPPRGIGSTGIKGDYDYDPASPGYDYTGYRISDFEGSPGGIGFTDMVPVLSGGALHNAGWLGSLAQVDSALPGVMIHAPSLEIHAEMMLELGMTGDPEGGMNQSFGEIYTRTTLGVMGGGFIEIVPGGKSDIYHMVEESGII